MDNVNTNVYVKSYINYNDLLNKPTINSVTLVGNLSLDDLGIQRILTAGAGINIDSSVISVLTDDTLSIYSENPVQNKVIKEALDAKQDNLSQIQIDAINSGINAQKVLNYDAHLVNTDNPHSVTQSQVGLENVDNTSDLDKPISTATQSALDGKQNNLTTAQLAAVNSGIDSTKVAQITTNQNNITTIQEKIPTQASIENQLADKDFVNSSIASNTGKFDGTFTSVSELNAYSGTVTNNDYAFVTNRVVTNNGSDWDSFATLNAYDKNLLTNFDYGWVINGSKFDLYRFDILNQTWNLRAENISKDEVTLNTAYNRYKATVSSNIVTWEYEYTLNNSSFTAAQWMAINSGITSALVAQINTNAENITTLETNKLDITTAASTYLPLSGGTLTNTSEQLKLANTNYATNYGTFVFDVPGEYLRIYNQKVTSTKPAIYIDYQDNTILAKGSKLKNYTSNTEGTILDSTDKAVANGLATLDLNVKVPLAQLPVDSVLDATSENPVQNKAIYAAIGDIETLLHNLNSGNTIGE